MPRCPGVLGDMKPLYPPVARFPWGSSVCRSAASLRAAIADRIPETGKTAVFERTGTRLTPAERDEDSSRSTLAQSDSAPRPCSPTSPFVFIISTSPGAL
jgi:hypothetical protein